MHNMQRNAFHSLNYRILSNIYISQMVFKVINNECLGNDFSGIFNYHSSNVTHLGLQANDSLYILNIYILRKDTRNSKYFILKA